MSEDLRVWKITRAKRTERRKERAQDEKQDGIAMVAFGREVHLCELLRSHGELLLLGLTAYSRRGSLSVVEDDGGGERTGGVTVEWARGLSESVRVGCGLRFRTPSLGASIVPCLCTLHCLHLLLPSLFVRSSHHLCFCSPDIQIRGWRPASVKTTAKEPPSPYVYSSSFLHANTKFVCNRSSYTREASPAASLQTRARCTWVSLGFCCVLLRSVRPSCSSFRAPFALTSSPYCIRSN